MEVMGLGLTAAEWLSLLSLRTTDIALEIVTRAKEMGVTDPDSGLEFIWEQFEERFGQHSSEAEKILRELRNF